MLWSPSSHKGGPQSFICFLSLSRWQMPFVACPVSNIHIKFTFFLHRAISLVPWAFPDPKTLEFSLSYNLSFAISQKVLFLAVLSFCNIFSNPLPSPFPQRLINIQPNSREPNPPLAFSCLYNTMAVNCKMLRGGQPLSIMLAWFQDENHAKINANQEAGP